MKPTQEYLGYLKRTDPAAYDAYVRELHTQGTVRTSGGQEPDTGILVGQGPGAGGAPSVPYAVQRSGQPIFNSATGVRPYGVPDPVASLPEGKANDMPSNSPQGPVVVTPGETNAPHQMNVVEYGGNLVGGPSDFFTTDDPSTRDLNESMFLSQRNHMANANASGNIQRNQAAYDRVGSQTHANDRNMQAAQADQVRDTGQGRYDAASAEGAINQHQTQAAQGQLSGQSQVDMNAGEAQFTAGEAAQQDFDAVDPRATVRGQLEQMQSDWVDPVTGEPTIPLYAQAAARNVSKIAAFNGLTGTAHLGALTTAMQEASITMASADAQFFQTLTIKNLDNRQEMAVQNANILANMEMQNADNRLAAAIQNSQQFIKMDLANLDNQQQANVIDSQARIQSILEATREENVARRFGAETDMYYDQLNTQIDQFNAGLTQDARQFNSTMEDSRQKWYANMQFQIDQSNAEWRRNVTLNEDAQNFEAARQDVQNMLAISNEQLNQLWDRSDAILDYAWKTADNAAQRDHEMVLQQMINQAQADARREARNAENEGALGSLIGGIVGDGIGGLIGSIFG